MRRPEDHDIGYFLNDERRAQLYEARDRNRAGGGKQMGKSGPKFIQDAENGFVYCVKCGEKAEECKCRA